MPLEVIRLDPQRAENAVNAYGDSLLRLCSVMLGNREDALDAVQETFLKYMTKSPAFNDSEHEKAWLLRVASNECKDMLRMRRHSSLLSLDDIRDREPKARTMRRSSPCSARSTRNIGR